MIDQIIRPLVCIALLLAAFVYTAAAQEPQPPQAAANQCPADRVCITREAALKALADADRVKALEAEIKAKDEALSKQKDLLNDMRAEFARASGENTILKQQQIRDSALIELFTKMVRPKKIGLNIF